MKTEWDLDVNVVTFVLSDESIDRQHDAFPVILDLDRNGGVVEIEVVLPAPLDDLQRIIASTNIDPTNIDAIINTVGYGNMRALMFGTPTIPQSPYVADPNEVTVREFQVA
jgi:hypothetical protein